AIGRPCGDASESVRPRRTRRGRRGPKPRPPQTRPFWIARRRQSSSDRWRLARSRHGENLSRQDYKPACADHASLGSSSAKRSSVSCVPALGGDDAPWTTERFLRNTVFDKEGRLLPQLPLTISSRHLPSFRHVV